MDNHFNYQQLRQLIETYLDLDELHTLCFDLSINFDDLSGDRLGTKTIALIEYMRKREQMPRLLAELQTIRPATAWPEWKSTEEEVTSDPPLPPLIFSDIDNPFGLSGKIQNPTNYIIRQPLTNAIMHELQKGVSLSITGPSQTGKSSLLWYISQFGHQHMDLSPEDFIYLSLELIHSDDDLFDYICMELDIPSARGFRLARQLRGRKIILCLDEIEKMTWDGFSLNVRTELRGLADGATAPFTLVIASRSSLGQLFPDSPKMTSPLAGLCMQINMPFFTLEETQLLVNHYLQQHNVFLPPEEIEKAWQVTQGHPRHLQLALKDIFAQFVATGGANE